MIKVPVCNELYHKKVNDVAKAAYHEGVHRDIADLLAVDESRS